MCERAILSRLVLFSVFVTQIRQHQVPSYTTTPEKSEKATITDHFGFAFVKNSGREIKIT